MYLKLYPVAFCLSLPYDTGTMIFCSTIRNQEFLTHPSATVNQETSSLPLLNLLQAVGHSNVEVMGTQHHSSMCVFCLLLFLSPTLIAYRKKGTFRLSYFCCCLFLSSYIREKFNQFVKWRKTVPGGQSSELYSFPNTVKNQLCLQSLILMVKYFWPR